jgi:hypothetical protein
VWVPSTECDKSIQAMVPHRMLEAETLRSIPGAHKIVRILQHAGKGINELIATDTFRC